MKNVVLFGDSLFGRFGRDCILQLEQKTKDTVVYNCAAGGFNTRDGIRRAGFIAKLHADYVCLSFGANDSNPFMGQAVPLEEFAENLATIVESFKGSRVILFPCPPVYDANDREGTKNFNDILARYNQAIKDAAQKTGSIRIDSEAVFGKLFHQGKNYHMEDGLHLNELGYQELIKELARLVA